MQLKLPRDRKLEIVREVQHYFFEERDEELGDLAAEFLVDFMAGQLGPLIYNQALSDARAIVGQRWQTLDEELFALEEPPPPRQTKAKQPGP